MIIYDFSKYVCRTHTKDKMNYNFKSKNNSFLQLLKSYYIAQACKRDFETKLRSNNCTLLKDFLRT